MLVRAAYRHVALTYSVVCRTLLTLGNVDRQTINHRVLSTLQSRPRGHSGALRLVIVVRPCELRQIGGRVRCASLLGHLPHRSRRNAPLRTPCHAAIPRFCWLASLQRRIIAIRLHGFGTMARKSTRRASVHNASSPFAFGGAGLSYRAKYP